MTAHTSNRFRCLITAGPTREHLDPVRFFSNGSSGKMGYALAEKAIDRGWEVDLISGPVALDPPPGANLRRVISAAEMLTACRSVFSLCDCLIMCAAVSDYRPVDHYAEKQKKRSGRLTVEMEATVDIIRTLAADKADRLVVGFAAETTDVEASAMEKLKVKHLDWIVANQVGRGIGMETDDNAVLMISDRGERVSYGPAPKADVAAFILRTIALSFRERSVTRGPRAL